MINVHNKSLLELHQTSHTNSRTHLGLQTWQGPSFWSHHPEWEQHKKLGHEKIFTKWEYLWIIVLTTERAQVLHCTTVLIDGTFCYFTCGLLKNYCRKKNWKTLKVWSLFGLLKVGHTAECVQETSWAVKKYAYSRTKMGLTMWKKVRG